MSHRRPHSALGTVSRSRSPDKSSSPIFSPYLSNRRDAKRRPQSAQGMVPSASKPFSHRSSSRQRPASSTDDYLVWKLRSASSSRTAHRILDEEHALDREYYFGEGHFEGSAARDEKRHSRDMPRRQSVFDKFQRTHDLLDEVPPLEKLESVREELEALRFTGQLSTAMERYAFFDRLLELRVEAMALCMLHYGPDSLQTIESIIDIGNTYIEASNFEQAAVHLKRGLSELTRYLDRVEVEVRNTSEGGIAEETPSNSPSHGIHPTDANDQTQSSNPESLTSTTHNVDPFLLPNLLCALCRAYIHMQSEETALACLREAKRQHEKLNPSQEVHYDVEMLFYLIHDGKNAHDEALTALQRAWQAKDELNQGEQNHPDIGTIYQLMGKTYRKMDKMDDCLNAWKTALQVFTALGDDAKRFDLVCAIGAVHAARGAHGDALENFQIGLALSEQLHGKYSQQVIEIYESIAQVQFSLILQRRSQMNSNSDEGEEDESESIPDLVQNAIETFEVLIHRKLESLNSFEPKKMIVMYERLGDCYGVRGGETDFSSQKLAYSAAKKILEENFSRKRLKQSRERLEHKLSVVAATIGKE